ncbi:hypothetical protein BSL78_08966 [Apostichopus japonicus]|uniref:PHD-type domain-containing protein n=1 Tax=Stichopus japonicus TaxID=307972 RepID=A0A2G8L1P5_STIJA|nr:hypothetical protein BSL78_08966 [Apostichopus japonicus]
MDGHRSHINLETANFCSENKVILFCFPAHASHILQPCDLSLFKSVKTYWKKEVQQWQIDNPGQNVTKQTFACIFYKAWRQSAMPKIAANGFRAAGLYPFTKEFDKAKVAPSEIFRSQEIARISDYDMPILSPIGEFSEEATSPHQQPDNRVRVPVQGVNNVAATMARKALEGTFTPEKIWVFERRLREGFDIETDELFNTWKKLKLQEANKDSETVPPAAVPAIPSSPTRRPVLTSAYVSPSLDKYLRYPKAPESRRPAKATKQLPKAISGKKYRQYLEDKLSAKAELERTRREKKVIREARKVEKVRLQKERAKRLEDAKQKSRVKRPVCRKLMADLPERAEKTASGKNDARVVHATVTSVGRDQQQSVATEVMDEEEQGIEAALEKGPALSKLPDRSEEGPALSKPPDRSEDGPALSKPPDGSPVIANTLVQLGLDDSLKFPSPPSTSETPESLEMPSLEQMEVLPTSLATDELLPDGEEAELLSNMKEALAMVNETWEEQHTGDVVMELGDDVDVSEGERPATDGEVTRLSKDGDLPIEVEVREQPPSAAEASGALEGVLIASNEDGEGTSNQVEAERTEETDTRPMEKKIKLKFMKKSGRKKVIMKKILQDSKRKGQEDDWTLVDENICDICEQCYRDDDDDWVGCEWCPRWFHKGCTDIADIHDMSEREIHSVEWFCHHCL